MGLFESREEKENRLKGEKEPEKLMTEEELEEFMTECMKEEELEEKEEELYKHRYNIKGNYVTEVIYGSSYENLIININKYYAQLTARDVEFDIVNVNTDSYVIEAYSDSREGVLFDHIEKTNTTFTYQFVATITIKIK